MDAIFYDDNPLPGETGEDFQEEDFQEEVDNEDKVDNEDNEEDEINEYPSDLDNEYPDSDYYDEKIRSSLV